MIFNILFYKHKTNIQNVALCYMNEIESFQQ